MADEPTKEAVWFERMKRATRYPPDDRGHRAPRVTDATRASTQIWHELLAILSNSPTFGHRARPNPWYRDPLDEEAIREGTLEQLDRLGDLFHLGPFPR
jgi:hypothetical protein